MLALKTILHPNDFSPLSTQALHLAHALARDYKARLILLYVRQPQETIEGEFGLMPPEEEPSSDDVMARLEDLIPDGSPVQVDTAVAEGDRADAIVAAARQYHCDLIVMGTHGRHGLSRLLRGSITDNVVRHAPCPVITLRSSHTEIPETGESVP
jgi:nucleotide-binding universal stress UspA family protein